MPKAIKTVMFLRGLDSIWPTFKELATKETYIDRWGRNRKLSANRALELVMKKAIKEDRLPTIGEMTQQTVVEFPYPWLSWRPSDGPKKKSKAVLVKGIDRVTRDHFKALCARRGKGISQAISMLLVLAIEKKKLPKGKAGEK